MNDFCQDAESKWATSLLTRSAATVTVDSMSSEESGVRANSQSWVTATPHSKVQRANVTESGFGKCFLGNHLSKQTLRVTASRCMHTALLSGSL